MEQYKHAICLLTCYFGKALPDRAAYFFTTAGWNSSVDFIVFSDSDAPADLPANVKFVPMGMGDFNRLVSGQLGIDINVEQGEKVKDFRPAYGKILASYIEGYDFWGHVDTDILLGNIRAFLTEEVLEQTDIFSVRDDFPAGYFTLYRNSNDITNLFMQSKDWQRAFTNPAYTGFDECGLTYSAYLNRRRMPQDGDDTIVSMADVLDMQGTGLRIVRQLVSHELGYRELLEVTHNGIERLGKEGRFMVVSFHSLHRQPAYVYPKMQTGDNKFYVDVFGLLPCKMDTVLTVADRDQQILAMHYQINGERTTIKSDGEVHINIEGTEWFEISKYILINTQLLLYVHNAKLATGNDIVDFVIQSKLFSIQKQVPPSKYDVEMVLLNILCGLVEFGQLTMIQ
jgi:hypothetical protein